MDQGIDHQGVPESLCSVVRIINTTPNLCHGGVTVVQLSGEAALKRVQKKLHAKIALQVLTLTIHGNHLPERPTIIK